MRISLQGSPPKTTNLVSPTNVFSLNAAVSVQACILRFITCETQLCGEFVIAININLVIYIEYENPSQKLLQRSNRWNVDPLTPALA